jgi:DNA-binding transcriptional ArsR family regulator
MSAVVDVIRQVAHPGRLAVLLLLAKGERPSGEMARAMGLSGSAMSHELARLRDGRFVRVRRLGVHALYRLSERGRELVELAGLLGI